MALITITTTSPHVGDIGTAIIIKATEIDDNGDEQIVDLTTATNMVIRMQKPDSTIVEKTATLTTDGSDGKFQFISEDGDFDQAGTWKILGIVYFNTSRWATGIEKIKILPIIGV